MCVLMFVSKCVQVWSVYEFGVCKGVECARVWSVYNCSTSQWVCRESCACMVHGTLHAPPPKKQHTSAHRALHTSRVTRSKWGRASNGSIFLAYFFSLSLPARLSTCGGGHPLQEDTHRYIHEPSSIIAQHFPSTMPSSVSIPPPLNTNL